jgi:hypothetical protein
MRTYHRRSWVTRSISDQASVHTAPKALLSKKSSQAEESIARRYLIRMYMFRQTKKKKGTTLYTSEARITRRILIFRHDYFRLRYGPSAPEESTSPSNTNISIRTVAASNSSVRR